MRPVIFTCVSLLLPAITFAQSSSLSSPSDSDSLDVVELRSNRPILPSASRAFNLGERAQPFEASPLASQTKSTGINFSKIITFDEFEIFTPISDNYLDRGILFNGSNLIISPDAGSSSAPVLVGTPIEGEPFEGNISGQFVKPGTDTPAPVYKMSWKIGGFDELASVQMDFFTPAGQLLFSYVNTQLGFRGYTATGGNIGIGSWRFHIVSTEPSGFGIDNLYFSVPGQDDLDREKGEVDCSAGNPVNPAVGNKYQMETDYEGSRDFPLTVTRAYNSLDGSWQIFPAMNKSPEDTAAQLVRADGKGLSYLPFGGTNWKASSTDITGGLATLLDSEGQAIGWQYITLDNQVEQYDTEGRVTSIAQRSGITHSYTYTDNTITVTHSLGGRIVYSLDSSGEVTGFTDPDGNSYGYAYNTNGMFESVTYPNNGGSRQYHYEDINHRDLLTGISDANGHRFASWTYDNDRRAISSEHHNGAELVRFDYSMTDNVNAPRTTVKNALGKDTTYHYITVNGARKVHSVSGHASANCVAANQDYGFDSNAFIASKTDWKGNVTAYSRNNKGQILQRTDAQGSAAERITITEWHPVFNLPLKIIEPGKETTFTYDNKGNQLSRRVSDTKLP